MRKELRATSSSKGEHVRPRDWLRRLVALAAGALGLVVCAALAVAADRGALWQVVRACVADEKLAGLPFPCLAVDLAGGEDGGYVLLRPPWSNDLVLSPTRAIVGREDPFLLSPEAPNYFAAAWRARNSIVTANGRPPARGQVALVVNSRRVRVQDQLHIHIGCLVPYARRALAEAAPGVPLGGWRLIGPVIPHQPFWTTRIRNLDLKDVEPFRIVDGLLGRAVSKPEDIMFMVVGAEVDGEEDFLILATYAHAPGSWWPVGAEEIIDRNCSGEG